MGIQVIAADSGNNDNLPWVNEFLDEGGEPGDSSRVDSIKLIKGKGYLVLCEHFKAFLFKGSKIYDFVTEAVPYWRKDGKLPYAVYAVINRSGKIDLGTDTDLECTATVDSKGGVDFKYMGGELPIEESPNPFLKGLNSPLTDSSVREQESPGIARKKKAPF